LVKKKFGCYRLLKIKGEGLDRNSGGLEFGRELSEFVGAAGNEDKVVMIASKEFGKFVSDPARCAGDKNVRHAGILADRGS